jgi:hypothetical protein
LQAGGHRFESDILHKEMEQELKYDYRTNESEIFEKVLDKEHPGCFNREGHRFESDILHFILRSFSEGGKERKSCKGVDKRVYFEKN